MNNEVKALKSELALLKAQFSEQINAVESRLDILIAQQTPSQIVPELHITPPEPVAQITKQDNTPQISPSIKKPALTGKLAAIAAEPSFIEIFLKTVLMSFFDLFTPVSKIYLSYKNRGMLGTLILTAVGLGLTLAGFGYLMQLLIDQLGAGSKSLLMSVVAASVVVLGIGLKIETRYGEFATAIVTLGILLSYSTIYFTGSVYGLLPNAMLLFLYLAIALVCHSLALLLDTKIVAALGVIGIATMPILSNTISAEPTYYLLSLAFVVASSLILAFRKVGQWLAHLTLAFTLAAIEWVIGFESVSMSPWVINLFYLLFLAYVFMSLLKEQGKTNRSLGFLAALVGSTVLVFFQATAIFTTQISLCFGFNAVIAGAISLLFYKTKNETTHFFILLSALWGVLAVISAISDTYWGIAWAIEGLLLLVVGYRYQMAATINHGQIITAIALLYSWSALASYFPLPALQTLDGWVLAIFIVAVIAIWQRIISNHRVFNQITQHKIKPLLQLLEAIWLVILVIASANIWLGNWTGALVILVQMALLFRAKICKQTSIEIFAAILISVPLFYIYQGALSVDSYRFTMLPWFAKLAVLSVFIQLWLWSAFYRRYQPDSAIKSVAESTRILFYLLIPVCWIGSAIRHFDAESLMLLWLSPLVALFLARKIKHHLLLKETMVLTVLSSILFAVAIEQLSILSSVISLLGFFSLYAVAYFLNRKKPDPIYQFICSCGILALGLAIPSIVVSYADSLVFGGLVAALYWSAAFSMINNSEHLKRNEVIIIAINLLLVASAWPLMALSYVYGFIPTIFVITILYQKEQRFCKTLLGKRLKLNGDIFIHTIIAISYVMLCSVLTEFRADLLIAPALAIHGALILFLKDRRTLTVKYSFGLILLGIVKLALIDAANALLWQKVILFMGIGVFILVASFGYQKLVGRTTTESIEQT